MQLAATFGAGFLFMLTGLLEVVTPWAQTLRDDSGSRAPHTPVISTDGAWMAAEEHPDRDDGRVRVWSTKRDITFIIERGQNPRISRDSRWVSTLQRPPLEDSMTAKPRTQRAGQTLVLLDLQDGSRRTFDFVLSYDMTYASTYLLYLQSLETEADEGGPSEEEATTPATMERRAGTLHQVPLNAARLAQILRPYVPDEKYTKANVLEIAAHPHNDHFAYVFRDAETGGETLHIVKWGIRAWYKGNRIEGLSWAGGVNGGDESISLGFLDSVESTDKDGTQRMSSALYKWEPTPSPGVSRNPAAMAAEFTRVDAPSATDPLVAKAQRFRSLMDSGDYVTARSMAVDDTRRWFEQRQGAGQPWRIEAGGSGPWAAWDEYFKSQKIETGWRRDDSTAILTLRETNDYFQLLDRGWTTSEIVYLFDATAKIEGILIRAVGDRPPGRTEEFLRWAREHEPEELQYLMPEGEVDPAGDRPARFRGILTRWRQATGLPAVP